MPQTCQSCHFAGNSDFATSCSVCGSSLGGTPSSAPYAPSSPPSGPSNAPGIAPPFMPGHPPASIHVSALPAATAPTSPHPTPLNTPQLEGMITWLNQTSEQVDFNWYKFLSQSLLFLIFLPLMFGLFAICTALWVASMIAGLHVIARSVSPFGMISGINSLGTLVAVVFPRIPRCEQAPVVRLTIQTQAGERPAFIKGELVSGTFRRGDDLELYGEWRNGTLVVRRGRNRSLATAIEPRRDHWQAIFFVILSLLVVGGYFIFSLAAHR